MRQILLAARTAAKSSPNRVLASARTSATVLPGICSRAVPAASRAAAKRRRSATTEGYRAGGGQPAASGCGQPGGHEDAGLTDDGSAGLTDDGSGLTVEVVRSARRRRTVEARVVGGVLRVSIPASLTRAEEARWVAEMLARAHRRSATAEVDLEGRAETLSERHGLPMPTSIRWADNQRWRWGSCTPADRSVRISSRLVGAPSWVLDYVIVHELAHLVTSRHDAAFWALVERYPRAERARGYLIAKGGEDGA